MKHTRRIPAFLTVATMLSALGVPPAHAEFTKVDQFQIEQQSNVFGITFDGTNWHVAQLDRNTFANYDSDFGFIDTTAVAGVGDMGGLAFAESSGTIFVIDRSTNIVREVDLDGSIVGQFTGNTSRNPNDIAYDPVTDTLWLIYFHGIIENRSLDGVLISSFLTDLIFPNDPPRWSGIEVDPVSDTLLLLECRDDLFEYTKDGVPLQLLFDDEDGTPNEQIVGNGLALDYDGSTGTLHMTTQSDGVVILVRVRDVMVDIKPGSQSNPINPLSRGVIPVAILGSDTLDVSDIDVSTLAFGPQGAVPQPSGRSLRDANEDGFRDLVLLYRTRESGIAVGDQQACLTGKLLDGTLFEGCDSLRAVPPVRRGGGARPRDATLYGVTGDGAAVPESLFTLSEVDAAATLVGALGNGSDGEAIAFNPDDGLLYHASGLGTQNISEIFESINPIDCCAPTPIQLMGDDYREATALTYNGAGVFLLADLSDDLYEVTAEGVVSLVGPMDHQSKGFAIDGGVLYSVSRDDNRLREIDPTDGSTLSSVAIDAQGAQVLGANGLAANPATGELVALLRVSGRTGRGLYTIDPETGAGALIGDPGDRFAGLAFVSEQGGPRCGLGFELALLLPPLMWLRRRRRYRM